MNRLLRNIVLRMTACLLAAGIASAQFKEIGPAPFPPAVAHQKIKALLENVNPSNRQETVKTLFGWVDWYRDLLDEELIAAWQRDSRTNLTEVMGQLADPRVASAVVEFSWRQRRQDVFIPANARMLGDLMERFAESAKPFRDDLLAPASDMPVLSDPEAETVCRILIDMPDLRTWRMDALRILPHYRRVAENLLAQDVRGSDREKSYRAQVWQRELKPDTPEVETRQPMLRRTPQPTLSSGPDRSRPVDPPQAVAAPAPAASVATRQPLAGAPALSMPQPETGPTSGTLECSGDPVPQNAEKIFPNLPRAKIQLDYDTKIWEARLAPGEGQTQRLILKNKGTGPQKRCKVHWSVIP
jgi:hypothetical protein